LSVGCCCVCCSGVVIDHPLCDYAARRWILINNLSIYQYKNLFSKVIMSSEFFGEWVFYTDQDDKNDAYEYLRLWKKYILRRLTNYEYIQEQYVDREKIDSFIGPTDKNTLGIKIEMRLKDEN
jgi:hypothetical protein